MPMSPREIFGRLQELKKWQQSHEKLLQRSSLQEESSSKEFPIQNSNSPSTNKNVDQDEIAVSLNKSFEQLLEEKLNEYTENSNLIETSSTKPKQPFLRKGSGLLKYNLKPEQYKSLIGNKFSNTLTRKRPKSVQHSNKITEFLEVRPQSAKPSNVVKSQNSIKRNNSYSGRTEPIRRTGEYSRRSNSPLHHETQQVKWNSSVNPKTTQKNPNNVRNSTQQDVFEKRKASKVIKNEINVPQKPEIIGDGASKQIKPKLHDFIETISHNRIEFSPLKIPELSIKPRGNWCDAYDSKSQNDNATYKNTFADNSGQSRRKNGLVKQEKELISIDDINARNMKPDYHAIDSSRSLNNARKSLSYTSAEHSLYEKALETELLIFEALEKRAEQSGFCSTNTSIIQLLASTPSKFNLRNAGNNNGDIISKKIMDSEDDTDSQPVRDQDVYSGIEDENVEVEIVQNNLQYLDLESFSTCRENQVIQNVYQQEEEEEEEVEEEEVEEEASDSNEDINEEYENEQKNTDEIVDQRNVSINTVGSEVFVINYSSSEGSEGNSLASVDVYHQPHGSIQNHQRPVDVSESCASCGFLLKNKIDECQSELENLKEEKNRIVAIRDQMAKDKKEFEKEIRKRRRHFEEQRLKFELEIQEEKKKLSEKQQTPEKSTKDVKLKAQRKKDREELNNLKMELNETKELMKLRETKNAMSIARLRNQVKQLEKTNNELKVENEKLMKEKAKLVVKQKTVNKSTENKMLKEISKNITKLTEETFKSQCFKVDTSSEEDFKRNLTQVCSKGDVDRRKSLNSTRGINKSTMKVPNGSGEGSIEDYLHQNVANEKNIEETYKSLFGGQDAIIEENVNNNNFKNQLQNSRPPTLSLGKTERILDDGTKEIKYTNGNTKIVSPDGTIRYYYSSNDTWHTNFPDGTEVLEFPNGQSEKRFKDGKCLVFFPDGLIQTIFPDGTEEVKYRDGSKLLTKKDGDRMLFLTNGQVEIHTKDQKRREYPDGTVKILYPDGTQETKYANGRVRIKNSQGDIILDTGEIGE